ncbi:MAG: 30S ribosome-binding factor RbfA [Alphaproteobacteria bacterium]|nr:30S ribosome-binding factor RbfA [Alphaproteobacteria bacterium]
MARKRTGDPRPDRVGMEIHSVLASLIREELKDPRVTALSITKVRMSKDLRLAHVNLVPLGGQGDGDAMIAGLDAASGFLRRALGQRLRLRHTPELHFHLDDGVDESVRMASMLHDMEQDRLPGADADGEDGDDLEVDDDDVDDEDSYATADTDRGEPS